MSRARDEGFRYCSQDTDTFFDPKIRMLIASHGCDGYAVWDYIKLAAYREHGYYTEWDSCRSELAAADLGISINKIGLIIDYLVRRSLLSCISRTGVKVLTSKGIQKRFQRMARDSKRIYTVEREIWLLSEDETLDCIKSAQKTDSSGNKDYNSGNKDYNSGIINTKSKQRKTKQIKKSSSARTRANDEDDDRTERDLAILSLCRDVVGSLCAADEKLILDEARGMDMDAVETAIKRASKYSAKSAKYLADTLHSQKIKPERKPQGAPAQRSGGVLQGGIRRAPRIPDAYSDGKSKKDGGGK